MPRYIVLVLLLLSTACAGSRVIPDPTALEPLPFAEARRFREMPLQDTPRVIVLVVPPGVEPTADPPATGIGRAAISVEAPGTDPQGSRWWRLGAYEALVLDVPSGAAVLRAGATSNTRDRSMNLALSKGETHVVAIANGITEFPAPAGPRPPGFLTRIAAGDSQRLLAARTLMRPAQRPRDGVTAPVRAIEDTRSSAAVKSGAIPRGMGRLLVASGSYTDERMGWVRALNQGFELDRAVEPWGEIVIEGTSAGAIADGDVLAMDLPPGTYAVRWRPHRRTLANMGPLSPPRAVEVRSGEATLLMADLVYAQVSWQRDPNFGDLVDLMLTGQHSSTPGAAHSPGISSQARREVSPRQWPAGGSWFLRPNYCRRCRACPRRHRNHHSTLPMRCTARSRRALSCSKKRANSGASR
jgi:hypothetical protein